MGRIIEDKDEQSETGIPRNERDSPLREGEKRAKNESGRSSLTAFSFSIRLMPRFDE
jgi:hypothetical protein